MLSEEKKFQTPELRNTSPFIIPKTLPIFGLNC